MKRWCWVLSCMHNILSDDPPAQEERCFCPGCGHTYLVVDSYVHLDEEMA